jgi:hypothetical protein
MVSWFDPETERSYNGVYEIVRPDQLIEGLSSGEWIARYCQWLTSIPIAHNPLFDETGDNIPRQQMGPVFFLPNASENSKVRRKCTISERKIVLCAINTSLTVSAEHQGRTCQDMRIMAMRQEIAVPQLGLTINNREIHQSGVNNLMQHRLGSPLFSLLLRENNILGITVEPDKALSTVGLVEGYWVMMHFQPGTFAIHFKVKGTYDDEPELEIPFETDVFYDLTVVKEDVSYPKDVAEDISPSLVVHGTRKSEGKVRAK